MCSKVSKRKKRKPAPLAACDSDAAGGVPNLLLIYEYLIYYARAHTHTHIRTHTGKLPLLLDMNLWTGAVTVTLLGAVMW